MWALWVMRMWTVTALIILMSGRFRFRNVTRCKLSSVLKENQVLKFLFRTSSPGLDSLLKREVSTFAEELKKSSGLKSGQISLEFFQRKRTRWPFPPENIPWEVSCPAFLCFC